MAHVMRTLNVFIMAIEKYVFLKTVKIEYENRAIDNCEDDPKCHLNGINYTTTIDKIKPLDSNSLPCEGIATEKCATNDNKCKIGTIFKNTSRIGSGDTGGGSGCDPTNDCINDPTKCINIHNYGQCGIAKNKINEICGNWTECYGVVYKSDYKIGPTDYCLARGNINMDLTKSDMWVYKKQKICILK